jgi:GNAT superfamily N-acetyltransferase
MNPTGKAIAGLRRGHIREAAEFLAERHQDYPSFRHLFPEAARPRRALPAFFWNVVGDAWRLGASHVAARAGGALLGVAVWLAPGTYPWSAPRKLRAAPALLRVALVAPGSARDFARTGANTERANPVEPHWYLEVLGVRPEAQGHGVGTRLLGLGLARAKPPGLPYYLETHGGRTPAITRASASRSSTTRGARAKRADPLGDVAPAS